MSAQQTKLGENGGNEVSAGCFPTLTDGRFRLDIATKLVMGKTVVDVSFLSVDQISNGDLQRYTGALESAFNTAWAMVLAKYAGTERAKFLALKGSQQSWKFGVRDIDLSPKLPAAKIMRASDDDFTTRAESFDRSAIPAVRQILSQNDWKTINTVVTVSDDAEVIMKEDGADALEVGTYAKKIFAIAFADVISTTTSASTSRETRKARTTTPNFPIQKYFCHQESLKMSHLLSLTFFVRSWRIRPRRWKLWIT